MTRRRLIFLLAILGGCRATPQQAVDQVRQALAERNQAAFYTHVDLERVAPQVAAEVTRFSIGVDPALADGMLRDAVTSVFGGSSVKEVAESVLGAPALFDGYGASTISGESAVIELRYRIVGVDSSPVLVQPVQLERQSGAWKIVALPGFGSFYNRVRQMRREAQMPRGVGGRALSSTEQALVASMVSDLKNLSTAEEVYFADSLKYFSAEKVTAAMPVRTANGVLFTPTAGVTIFIRADPNRPNGGGWYAEAYAQGVSATCVMGVNVPLPAGINEGEAVCR